MLHRTLKDVIKDMRTTQKDTSLPLWAQCRIELWADHLEEWIGIDITQEK